MNFNVKFGKNLRDELYYNCVDRKTKFILFYSNIERCLRTEDLTILFGVSIDRHTESRIMMQSNSMPIRSLVIIDLMQGNTIISAFIIILRNLLEKPMTQ